MLRASCKFHFFPRHPQTTMISYLQSEIYHIAVTAVKEMNRVQKSL